MNNLNLLKIILNDFIPEIIFIIYEYLLWNIKIYIDLMEYKINNNILNNIGN
jgi:hypothetical protein